jgi:hypothetical protein
MKYLRRYKWPKDPKLAEWHEVSEEEALRYVPKEQHKMLQTTFYTVQTYWAYYRRCTDEMAARLMGKTEVLS